MSNNSWVETIAWTAGDGAALVNSNVATSLLPGQAKPTLAAGLLRYVGQRMSLRAAGRISTVVTSPGTFTFSLRLGAVVVFNGGAMALNAVAKTNVSWILEADIEVRAIGNGVQAALLGVGSWQSEAVIGSPLPTAGGAGELILPASAPVVGTGFDSTIAQTVDLFGAWSAANAANSLQLHHFKLQLEN